MIKIITADDENILLRSLSHKLSSFWPEAEVIAQCKDGESALQSINRLKPDVAFLDIKMGGLTGLEISSLIKEPCKIVYVTAFDNFAVKAFEEGAVDYLLKPFSDQRLKLCINRLNCHFQPKINHSNSSNVKYLSSLHLSIGNKIWFQPVDKVSYFRSCGRYIEVITKNRTAVIRTPLSSLLKQLDPAKFWQIHRSLIINLEHLEFVKISQNNQLKVQIKHQADMLPVSRSFKSRFKDFNID